MPRRPIFQSTPPSWTLRRPNEDEFCPRMSTEADSFFHFLKIATASSRDKYTFVSLAFGQQRAVSNRGGGKSIADSHDCAIRRCQMVLEEHQEARNRATQRQPRVATKDKVLRPALRRDFDRRGRADSDKARRCPCFPDVGCELSPLRFTRTQAILELRTRAASTELRCSKRGKASGGSGKFGQVVVGETMRFLDFVGQ